MTVGAKRLALIFGCLGALTHLVFMMVYTEFLSEMDHTLSVWTKVVLVTAACFLIPFGLVYGITWVIGGFKLQAKNQTRRQLTKQEGGPAWSKRLEADSSDRQRPENHWSFRFPLITTPEDSSEKVFAASLPPINATHPLRRRRASGSWWTIEGRATKPASQPNL